MTFSNSQNPDEFARIAQIARTLGPPSSHTLLGIGDDTAVVQPSTHPLLVCTDAMVEGVHFDLSYCSPRDLGHKALASCLSDIAAMNGRPLHSLISLALPKSFANDFLTELYEGIHALAQKHQIDVIGGDLTSSKGGLFIDVVCLGEASHPITRAGAKAGDWIAVSGHPGASAAGLAILQKNRSDEQSRFSDLLHAHLRPQPRFDLLPELNETPDLCTSMIDISDGISSELHHIAERSGVGAIIERAALPIHPQALSLASERKLDASDWALSGGEDYELLVTLSADAVRRMGHPPKGFTIIGQVTSASEDVRLREANGSTHLLPATGFNHFQTTRP